jgi:site-specific DNA-methyltransferase (adenine-specific)
MPKKVIVGSVATPAPAPAVTAAAAPAPEIKKKVIRIKKADPAAAPIVCEQVLDDEPPAAPVVIPLDITPDAADADAPLHKDVRVIQGECLELLKTLPDNSVHLILCDLPYGTTKCKWDSVIDIDKLWVEYKRILVKPTGVVVLFGQQPFTTRLIAGNYEWFKYTMIWKKNKTTQYLLANYRPMKCTEDICVFSPGGAAAASRHKGNMTYNPQDLVPVEIKKKNSEKRIGKMLNQSHHLGPNNKLVGESEYTQTFKNYPTELIEFNIESDTIHETQKPVALIEYLIKTFSNPRDVVLDNTMGSGTTGIGCIHTNRQFIGMELIPKYFDLSCARISEAVANMKSKKEAEDEKECAAAVAAE